MIKYKFTMFVCSRATVMPLLRTFSHVGGIYMTNRKCNDPPNIRPNKMTHCTHFKGCPYDSGLYALISNIMNLSNILPARLHLPGHQT